MVCEICREEAFLAQKAEAATAEDLDVAQDLLDTLAAHRDGCVGMAANMIGVNKRIIAFESDGKYMVMLNPVIVRQDRVYQSAVAEREAPAAAQDLYRLDGRDHPARDRPL